MKAKILLITGRSKKEYVKEFKSLDDFNEFKKKRLNNNVNYIKYSLLLDNQKTFGLPIIEYGNKRTKC